ncbi:MAG: FkbM family methyltransferase [Anaerolineales bacterium]|nr:FkbM family methyltransferase [Anaerolineales bacterium]
MTNLRLRLTRHWPFPGKDILASLVFSKNSSSRWRFPRFDGIVTLPWGLMWCDTRSAIEWQLFVKNEYEPVVGTLISGLLRPGDCFVDVGANIGVHTLLAARRVGLTGKVIAVEPNAGIFERLRQNCSLNRSENVMLFQCALGDQAGKAQLSIFPNRFNQGLSTLVKQAGGAQQLEVDIVPGDELLGQIADRPIALIKVDTEGWEAPILRGFRRTLERYKPVVIFEHRANLWKAAGYTLREIVEFMAGYDLYEIVYAGLKPISDGYVSGDSSDIIALPARLSKIAA